MGYLASTKQRLATVSADSWHYRAVKYTFTPAALQRTKKACFYYWIRVPMSLIGAPLKLLWVGLVVGVNRLCGYSKIPKGTEVPRDFTDIWKPGYCIYGYSPRLGRRRRTEPWHFILPLVVAALSWYFWHYHPDGVITTGKWLGFAGAVVVVLALIGCAIHWQRGTLKSVLDRACPNLTVVSTEAPLEEAC